MSDRSQSSVRNNLLKVMSEDDFSLLQPFLSPLDLKQGEILIEQKELATEVYFVEAGLVSVVSIEKAEQQVEVGIYGFEGVGSIASLMAVESCPYEHLVQMSGTALSMKAKDLAEAQQSSPSLNGLLLRYAHAFSIQMASTAVANGIYHLDQRLARWLLMCQDRNHGNQLPTTHKFLSIMLATSRPSVTEAINVLESLELIKADRGLVTILNREGLKSRAGDCYGVAEHEYRRLIGHDHIFE